MGDEYYYCESCQQYFCKKMFKNRQAWGAHRSNCARGRQTHTQPTWKQLIRVVEEEYHQIQLIGKV